MLPFDAKNQTLFWREPISVVTDNTETIEYKNQYICALRGGKPFFNVTKAVDGECPTNTKACSSMTTGMNTVCYPEEDHETSCPITDIQFDANNKEQFTGYEELEYAGMRLVYTKNLID